MYKEVYLDIIFAMNFCVDYFLLRIIGIFFAGRKERGRYFLAAMAGAFFACIPYVIPEQMEQIPGILLHGFCAVLMLRVGPGFRRSGLLIKGVLLLYLTAFLFAGFLEASSKNASNSPFLFVILTAGFYLLLYSLQFWGKCLHVRVRNLYALTLYYDGKKYETCGFYDTGNLLCDPVSGKPVSVLNDTALKHLLGEEHIERLKYITVNPGELENTDLFLLKPHLVPFSSVGKRNGLLLAITLEELCIHTPKEEVRISAPVFAIQFAPSTLGSEYEVLLNSRLL